ncbi:hypothetical protein FOWG_18027 [Fusarium oxysporum f. sp. lycopersici MN25]|nr:hypothetical protein FOWG_18027 [Fusarium oxysporum f. sp. lycopersici MN25]
MVMTRGAGQLELSLVTMPYPMLSFACRVSRVIIRPS